MVITETVLKLMKQNSRYKLQSVNITALARTSSNCKRQTSPLCREGAHNQQIRRCLTVIKIWSWTPDECLTPKQTGPLTVDHNITLNLTLTSVENVTCRHGLPVRRVASQRG
jgi:hypothetical protein